MSTDLTNLLLGAGLNLLVALAIVRFIYYPGTQNKNYVFTFLAFNTVIYFVLGLLTSVSLSIGVGFGLFAIFSVLRYRTDEIVVYYYDEPRPAAQAIPQDAANRRVVVRQQQVRRN